MFNLVTGRKEKKMEGNSWMFSLNIPATNKNKLGKLQSGCQFCLSCSTVFCSL